MGARFASRTPLAVALALAAVYVLWGSTYLAIALAIETLPPFLMASVRFLVAGAVLYLVAARGGLARPRRRDWAVAAVSGTLMLAGGNGGVVWAEQHVETGIASLLIATVPLWIALVDRLAFGARLGRPALAGLVLGFGGVALLVNPGGGGTHAAGAVVLVLAALAWGIGSLVSRESGSELRPLASAAMQMLAGGVALAIGGVAAGELGDVHPEAFSARSVAALAYLVVFGSLVAFSAYVWLLQSTSTSLVATYAYVNPVVAVLLGWAFLGEDVTARTLVAGTVILGAVALIVSAGTRRPREREHVRPAPAGRAGIAGRSRAAAATRGR